MFRAILIALTAPATDMAALPVWLAGCWRSEVGESWTEECWSEPRCSSMIGYSRSGKGGQVTTWEVMEFQVTADAPDGAVARLGFWAAPQGKKWTMFSWSPTAQPGVTLYNVVNDYPQRIRYWRDGGDLIAEIARIDGSKARRWRYRRSSR
jgi:hypothetical protein